MRRSLVERFERELLSIYDNVLAWSAVVSLGTLYPDVFDRDQWRDAYSKSLAIVDAEIVRADVLATHLKRIRR